MAGTQTLLLLATLDGPIEAVNKLTGKTVWTLDGGMKHFWHAHVFYYLAHLIDCFVSSDSPLNTPVGSSPRYVE